VLDLLLVLLLCYLEIGLEGHCLLRVVIVLNLELHDLICQLSDCFLQILDVAILLLDC